MVPYKGPVSDQLTQLIGGLRAGMGLAGCASIAELHTDAKFTRVTAAGLKESHAHDVVITKEAPNYRTDR
jgi:IMP dehydrogenase